MLRQRQRSDAGRLGKRLDHDHAGHDRPPGEVPAHVPLVLRHAVLGDGAHAGLELEHPVEEEERIAMRKDRLDHVASERGLDLVDHHSPSDPDTIGEV